MRYFGWVALLAVAVTAATPIQAGVPPPGTVPGTLRIALTSEPNSLNPILSTQLIENFIGTFVYDGLVDTYPDGSFEARLARVVPTIANGGISPDGKTITFHLRRGV